MASRTSLWTLTNQLGQTVVCTLEEGDASTYRIVVSVADEVHVNELHYTPAAALVRARALRDAFSLRGSAEPTS